MPKNSQPSPHPPRPPLVEIRDLHKRFGDNHVLRGVSTNIYPEETLVLLGGSGGGKSVLMKHIIGLLKPDSGTLHVQGTEITSLSERSLKETRQHIGIMFQNGALFDSLTVGQNIAFPLIEKGLSDPQELERHVLEALEIVHLKDHINKMPSDLSGGMKKRVALARAVVEKPCLILYDEPHAGLDPITADSIDHLIKRLQRDHGITNVVVTHEMRSVPRIADRVIFMKEGTIYFEGSPEEFARSPDPLLNNFLHGRSNESWH